MDGSFASENAVQPNGDGSSDDAGDEGPFTEQYAAFLAEHKQNKARVKAEASRFVEQTTELVRNAYLDKLQDVDDQLQTLMEEKQQVIASKNRHNHTTLMRHELPNLDDLEKDFHTILKMRKVAADKMEDMSGTISPGKKSKGEELVGNLDSILAKRALLVDKISSFVVHMAGHDSMDMTPELHAELDDIYKGKWELASDMRVYAGSTNPPSEVADLQRRLNDLYQKKEELLTELQADNGGAEKLVWKRTEFPTPTTGGEKLVWKRTEFPGPPTRRQVTAPPAAERTEPPASAAGAGLAAQDPSGDAEEMGTNGSNHAPDAEEADEAQASDMKVIREAAPGDVALPAPPRIPPPEAPPEEATTKEEADVVLFTEMKRLVDLLRTQSSSNPDQDDGSGSSSEYERGVNEIASLIETMRLKIDDFQKSVNEVNGASAPESERFAKSIEEKRMEIDRIEEFASLCKKARVPDAEAFLPIVQAKMNVLKSDLSVMESKTIEMQTTISETGISQPATAPDVAIAVPSTINESRDPSQSSLLGAKMRVREAMDNVAYSAIAFCAFGLAVFILGIFAPVGFPCWGPAICLATLGAFYSQTRSNGIDSPVYPHLFRNGAVFACVLLVVSAALFGLAFFSIKDLRGTPACSSAILYSPACLDPNSTTIDINGNESTPPCFNDLSLDEYNSRLQLCETLHMCYNGKVKLASCDLIMAINGFGGIFSVSLAVTVVCVSMWVYFHLETRLREYHLLRERMTSEDSFDDTFVTLSTPMCLGFFGCGLSGCCAYDIEATGR